MQSWADQLKWIAALALAASLSACGLAETTVTAGAVAGSAAKQAKDAKQQEDQAKKAVDSALKSEESLRNEAERRATE